jgi:hypothetical protein
VHFLDAEAGVIFPHFEKMCFLSLPFLDLELVRFLITYIELQDGEFLSMISHVTARACFIKFVSSVKYVLL